MRLLQSVAVAGMFIFVSPMFSSTHPVQAESKVPVIMIHAHRYEFKPSSITLKEGQPVKLVFISDDVTHSLAVESLGLDVEIMRNHSAEVILTPSVVGDFEGECSRYCGAGHDRMKLLIHVTD